VRLRALCEMELGVVCRHLAARVQGREGAGIEASGGVSAACRTASCRLDCR
jgi:hypothetical protein